MNPYEPPKPPEPPICSKCAAAIEDEKPGPVATFFGWLAVFVFLAVTFYGVTALMRDYGIVDRSGERFWFEDDLRRWIWNR